MGNTSSQLFEAVSAADRKQVKQAQSIVNGELDEWIKHKPVVTQIIKLVQSYPGLFFLSTNAQALEAAHDYLQSEVKKHLKQNQEKP